MSPPEDVQDDEDGVADAARDLYAGPPGDFTAERDRLAREAKDAGDRDLAKSLQALKRPVVAAWAVNLLVREEPELIGQVLDVGEALREAQEGLAGDVLRELGRQRRQLIDSVVARARALVEEHGSTLSSQAEQQVAATLQAALADPAAATAVQSGLLVKPLESTGLGSTDLAEHVATAPDGTPPRPPRKGGKGGGPGKSAGKAADDAPDKAAQQAALREQAEERRRLKRDAAEQRVADAEQAVEEAQAERDARRAQHEEAHAHLLHLEARIDELRRQLADLESQAESASEDVEAREHEVTDADTEVHDAQRELASAREALSNLR